MQAAATPLASGHIDGVGATWQTFACDLLATDSSSTMARLAIAPTSAGTLWLDMVCLAPSDGWKGRPLRPDLMNMLQDLHPAFLRFPGGCWVEGDTMKTAYRWKETTGDPVTRMDTFNQMERWALAKGLIIPLASGTESYLIKPSVQSLQVTPFGIMPDNNNWAVAGVT